MFIPPSSFSTFIPPDFPMLTRIRPSALSIRISSLPSLSVISILWVLVWSTVLSEWVLPWGIFCFAKNRAFRSSASCALHTLQSKVRLAALLQSLVRAGSQGRNSSVKGLLCIHLLQISTITPADSALFNRLALTVFSTFLNFNFYPV